MLKPGKLFILPVNLIFSKSNVYFVGDEVRDIEAGKKTRIKTIAVSWGYNTKDALARERPDYLIDSPLDLKTIVLSK